MASGDTLFVLTPMSNEPPDSSAATFDTRGGVALLDFAAGIDENAEWGLIMPANYGTGGLTITIWFAASSGTTGNAIWRIAIEKITDDGISLEALSYANTQDSAQTPPSGTSGNIVDASITFTNAQIDGVTAGDNFRLRLIRVGSSASDTVTGDLEFVSMEVAET